ncbi:outer membrane beta-barrel protein [Mangrovimonas sp. TPBH4]|uniref:outer membrane beta-barrel protein n=1 Tax=Mangrovimonas sp. TPBH4 TaxID=1645914 RepID=UPI0018D103E3|nr:outer membrane beta-barrel protein [Mangrovimonas sp. TPBH4]
MDWNNNPSEIKFKLAQNSEIKTANLKSIKEFGIYNKVQFIKSDVEIDVSSDDHNILSYTKDPIFEQQEIFLKVIASGEANLYSYRNDKIKRYFFNLNDSRIEQLIFKKYKISEIRIQENALYKQQLWNALKCESISIRQIRKLKYYEDDLLKLFTIYNQCQNSAYEVPTEKEKRDLINLTIRPRINNSILSMNNTMTDFKDSEFKRKNNFGIGLEAEIVLPFNKNKWSFFIEPTYQYFKSKSTQESGSFTLGEINSTVNYESIELPIGFRHYFFLNNSSKLFLNVALVFDFSFSKSKTTFVSNETTSLGVFEMHSMENYAIGAGYKLKDKYSFEVRYFTNRNVLKDYVHWDSEYSTVSFILGYSFL